MLELLRFLSGLAQLCRLRLDFALRRCEFARQRGAASAFLVERLTMLLRASGQLLSRGGGLLHEDGHSLPLLFERLCARLGFRLLELPCFVACLALRRLHLNCALCRCQLARQRGAACALLVERLAMLRRARGQLCPRGRGLLREGGRFLALLFNQLYALRGFRLLELG
ncbi:hypothetical protein ACFIOY_37580 [Bradyrhizobium sp. TZ2]